MARCDLHGLLMRDWAIKGANHEDESGRVGLV
jgi:hypothetical protein